MWCCLRIQILFHHLNDLSGGIDLFFRLTDRNDVKITVIALVPDLLRTADLPGDILREDAGMHKIFVEIPKDLPMLLICLELQSKAGGYGPENGIISAVVRCCRCRRRRGQRAKTKEPLPSLAL